MRANLHSLWPVATRRFSVRPTHVANDTGQEALHQSRRGARDSMGW